MPDEEVVLMGGRTTAKVVRVADTVRRPLKERSAFVHDLLRHLEARGFRGSPRFKGIDSLGREVLTFLPGSVPEELGHFSDAQLAAAARLLRELHDHTTDCSLRGASAIVCHGDASPCNCVFIDGAPVAFIDFDNAHAGTRIEDVGYAAWLWLDIGNSALSAEYQGSRAANFLTAYGLAPDLAVPAIIAAQKALGARTDSARVRAWSEICLAWVQRHKSALTGSRAAG
jgi:Ser/Thr protein kinase RdoA (MazF antagonist)